MRSPWPRGMRSNAIGNVVNPRTLASGVNGRIAPRAPSRWGDERGGAGAAVEEGDSACADENMTRVSVATGSTNQPVRNSGSPALRIVSMTKNVRNQQHRGTPGQGRSSTSALPTGPWPGCPTPASFRGSSVLVTSATFKCELFP